MDLVASRQVAAALAMAMLLYVCTYLSAARSWQLILRMNAVHMGFPQALSIIMISQLGKYLPGNVGHHLGRIVLSHKVGISAHVVVPTMVLEAMLTVMAAALCSLGALELLPEISLRYGNSLIRNAALAAIALLGLALSALALPVVRRHLSGPASRIAVLAARGNWLATSAAFGQNVVSLLLGAGALSLIVGSASPIPVSSILGSLLGTYSVAWLVGFLVPGAPAGLGVREALLVLGMTPMVGQETAITSAALLRVTTVAGDGISLLIGIAIRKFTGHAS